MSRTYKERSVPNMRGRRQERNTKRRSSKRIRRTDQPLTGRLDKQIRKRFELDRETGRPK